MGIRSRMIALVATSSLVLWLAIASVAVFYTGQAANETDRRGSLGGLDSASAAVASEQERLAAICGDWAAWDDTYEFIEKPKSDYVDSNLGDETLDNLGLDFMVFTDASGRIVRAPALDPTTRGSASLPGGLVRYLATRPATLRGSDPRAALSGGLSLQEGPYLIAAQPIGLSDFSAVPNGTLIIGYRIGEQALSKIRRLTRDPVAIYSSASPTLPADVRSALPALGAPGAQTAFMADESTMVAFGVVKGIGGGPGLIMRVSTPRTAYTSSRASLLHAGGVVTILVLAIVGMIALTLDRTVLRPLAAVSSAVSGIEHSTDTQTRVPVSGKDQISGLAMGINRMLDELGRTQTEVAYLVDHDPLTGLYNRRYFEKELQREIDEHERLGTKGAILWFDLDHFKEINDSLGHAAGDELLNAFGRHLLSQTRSYCTTARLGGDEFGMLIPHVKEPDAVRAAVRLIKGFSARTFVAGDRHLRIAASAGVVFYPGHGDQTSELLARADIAMYDAKAKGGNQVVVYEADDVRQNAMTERLEAAERIRSALREDRLSLYAQPILSSSGEGPRCFELCLRMRDEHGEMVLPADIIPTAERLGLIRTIDSWVVRRAIQLLARAQEHEPEIQFTINLSGAALADAELVDLIREEFRKTSASPGGLIIEVSERTTVADIEGAMTFIRGLQEMGCRFSIDDFGSEASSYYYLKHLPVDFIKLNGALVTGLASDSADANFVHAIVEMCRGLNIRTVAENVETGQSLDAISGTGVDFIQGYYVGMPEPLDFYLGDKFAD